MVAASVYPDIAPCYAAASGRDSCIDWLCNSGLKFASAEQAIKLFGTDFSLMEKMFPGRQRKALKFKLRREYKDNPERIDAALSGKGCDASSYQEVVKALHKVRRQSLSDQVEALHGMAWVRETWCLPFRSDWLA